MMKCLICNNNQSFFLTKTQFLEAYRPMVANIGSFDYFKCDYCGFTTSRTHAELSDTAWKSLNNQFHHFIENHTAPINQPPYLEQATLLKILDRHGLIQMENAIDYAGGYGTLSSILQKYFSMHLPVYDPYVTDENSNIEYINDYPDKRYDVLINSALFEHLFTRSEFDRINNLIDPNQGCMFLHTVVCDNIPYNENWFYFEPPVHCAFHTNKSMNILMEQWGFTSSLYCPKAKSWVLFKNPVAGMNEAISAINSEFQTEYILYNPKGFVDYWKGF